jgi:hypothetical protein
MGFPSVQECDATDDDSSNAAGNKKILLPFSFHTTQLICTFTPPNSSPAYEYKYFTGSAKLSQ